MENRFELRKSCPACLKSDLVEVAEIDYTDSRMITYLSDAYCIDTADFSSIAANASYLILKCRSCGLLFQAYIPSESFLSLIYDQYIDAGESLSNKEFTEEHSRMYLGDFSLITRLLGKPSSQIKMLDYAAGWGNWISFARRNGFTTYALELSEHRKEHLSRLGVQVVGEREFSSLSLDCINCDQIFEHLTNPVELLRKLAEPLGKNGLVRISVPHSFFPLREVARLKGNLKSDLQIPDILAPLEHLNYFNRPSLKALAELAGLEQVTVSLSDYLTSSNYRGKTKREVLKNISRPFYRKYFSNIVFLRKKADK